MSKFLLILHLLQLNPLDTLLSRVKLYETNQEYDSALVLAFRGIRRSQQLDEQSMEIKFRIRAGTILSDVDRNVEALSYYHSAYVLAEQINDPREMGRSLLGMGVTYHLTQNYDSALFFYRESLTHLHAAGDQDNYHGTLANMAMIYDTKGDEKQAEQVFQQSLDYREEHQDYKGLVGSYYNLSRNYLLEGELIKARLYALKSLQMAEANGFIEDQQQAYGILSRIYVATGQKDSLSYFFNKYDSLNQAWFHRDYGDKLLELETKFKTSEIEKDNALKQLQIEQQQQAQLLLGGVILLLVVGAIGFYLYSEQRKRSLISLAEKDKKLFDQQIEELLNREEIKTTYALLDGQDKERKRIAQELHDNISTTMATLNMFLSSFKPRQLDAKEQELLQRINEVAFQTAEDTRNLSHSLDAGSLSHFGLEVAIRDLLEAVENSGLKIESSVALDQALPGEVALNVYRILQELVNNTLKHAKAQTIHLEVNEIPGEYLSVIYADDGVGFSVDTPSEEGLGLRNIRSRVDSLDAQLTVDSVNSKYTTFILEIPLP